MAQDIEVFEIECILDKRKRKGKDFFLVKWKGYDEDHNTWEPAESFQEGFEDALADFNKRKEAEKKKRKSTLGRRRSTKSPRRKKSSTKSPAPSGKKSTKRKTPQKPTRRSKRLSSGIKKGPSSQDLEDITLKEPESSPPSTQPPPTSAEAQAPTDPEEESASSWCIIA
uniref:Chromo domain-containing protein n=1 Tax=Lotharella globosa TaxID=91324 RepID=A0A7S4DX17_9EUKA|mmetsp:Transcript_19748/g.38104  ORF Transcript_19748/g.38104 Transcript_19748/m.38104 type:complete len:169 (+) Transcript_19748:83-589(+)|eukprot:CAMPEP_0167798702 /NCGR_PEP_ID=MMETSP0111_2-20121227/16506_1 /TAXON_ID=91324 /ORGANISM="Lotharella globosa, Strain CCCM811" /LENGTH=168 /DNA_ID=CAMNT_0007693247 /DNA_START=62 /DNA_END=568 /DNA_ORIENTATION=-